MSKDDLPEVAITHGSHVTLHFTLSLPAGEVIDSTLKRLPARLTVGDGNLLPGFEARILGLKKGQKAEVILPASEAFGDRNEANIQRLPRDRFNRFLDDEYAVLGPGAVLAFKDVGGFDLPGVIKEISPSSVLVDFNHPLAGREICFKVEIIDVMPGDTQRLDVKL